MKKALATFAFLYLLTACSKTDADNTVSINNTNLAGTYKLTNEITTINTVANNTFDNYDACEKDDVHVFATTGGYTYTDAGTLCSPPNTAVNSTYTLNGNQLTLLHTGQTATVERLTANTLELYYESSFGSTTIRMKQFFTRQ